MFLMGAATPPFQGGEFAFSFQSFSTAGLQQMWDMLTLIIGGSFFKSPKTTPPTALPTQ